MKITNYPLLSFSPQFKEKILSGKKTVTFRRFKHAEEGDIFPFDSSHRLQITHIKAMHLRSFISLYWSADGFDSMTDASDSRTTVWYMLAKIFKIRGRIICIPKGKFLKMLFCLTSLQICRRQL